MPKFMLKGPRRAQSFVLRSYTMHELFFSLHWSILPRKTFPRQTKSRWRGGLIGRAQNMEEIMRKPFSACL